MEQFPDWVIVPITAALLYALYYILSQGDIP